MTGFLLGKFISVLTASEKGLNYLQGAFNIDTILSIQLKKTPLEFELNKEI